MILHKRHNIWILAAVIGIFLLRGLAPAVLSGNFPRSEDNIVLTGKDIGPAVGVNISKFNLAAIHGGKVEAIPFQVDELREGTHVFDWVSPTGAKLGLVDKDSDGGIFDADDELAFMAWDLGDKAAQKGQFSASRIIELAITDPSSGKTAYAYLLVDSSLPRSKTDYVQLKIAEPRYNVNTQRYQYSSQIKLGIFDVLKLQNATSGWTPNMVMHNGAPGKIVTRIGLKTELDFYDLIRGDVVARKVGPVRILWRCAGGADFGIIKIKAKGSTEQVYYANRMDMPVTLELPINFDSVLSSYDMRAALLLDPKSLPAIYYNSANRNGVRLDGSGKSAGNAAAKDKPTNWFVVSANGASLYCLALFSEEWAAKIKIASFVDDRQGHSEVGAQFGDMVHLLTKGKHEYIIRYYLLPKEFKWGDEKLIPEIVGAPLKIGATAI